MTATAATNDNEAETAVMGAVSAAAALSATPAASATDTTSAEAAPAPAATAPAAAASSTEASAPKAISDLVANYSDKLLMVVFWSVATETESPSFAWLNEMHGRYAKSGLQIMAVNQDKAAREGEAFAVKQGAQFAVSHDRSGDLSRALWVGKLPATYLLNDAGELLGSHTGFNDDIRGSYEDEIRRSLRTLTE